jgi:hypothetical protein
MTNIYCCMQYKIYKLQNKINGKIYIGKTKYSLAERMKSHRYKTDCKYIHNALCKYGEDAFTKDVIYETDDENDVCLKEKEFIVRYNSLVPNGYNLVLETNQGRIFHEKTRKLMSINTQGIYRTKKIWSRYIGVRTRKGINIYSTRITHNRKSYVHFYNTEIEAAEAYDKVALYLYGLNAKINFPFNLEKYRQYNLKKFFYNFCKKQEKTSKYVGVSYAPYIKDNKWRAIAYINRKQVNIGCFKTEKEAYEARKSYLRKTRIVI